MSEKDFFNFTRRDLRATAIYEFLGASLDEQISVLIKRSAIASAKPSGSEALLIDRWIANITRDYVTATDDDFAFAIRSERSAQLIENSNFGPCWYADRARFACGRGQRIAGNLVGGLRHAVGFENRDPKPLF